MISMDNIQTHTLQTITETSFEYFKFTDQRQEWSARFSREELRRGSLGIDVKTLFKTLPRIVRRNEPAVPPEWIEKNTPVAFTEDFSLTWVGHATFLLQAGGINGLIDPFWGDYEWGPFTLFQRLVPPAISQTEIPKLDFIAITHNHVDHCDHELLDYLQKRDNPLMCVPSGDGQRFEKMNFQYIEECEWGDCLEFYKGQTRNEMLFSTCGT